MIKQSDKNNKNVHIVYKRLGQTPLEAIKELQASSESLSHVPMTYAGRLDPMAEGTLVLLSGDEVHNKEDYLKLDKEYTFQVLFGFSTDTYDLLGRIESAEDGVFNTALFEKALESFVGTYEQAYPAYSSKTVEGKPLFEWAREGKLLEIDIPTHEITIETLDPVKVETISAADLEKTIKERISLVKGDFRQEEILELWEAYIKNSLEATFDLATVTVKCTSGTYVRSLVDDIGHKLNFPTTTFSIRRNSVGEYTAK